MRKQKSELQFVSLGTLQLHCMCSAVGFERVRLQTIRLASLNRARRSSSTVQSPDAGGTEKMSELSRSPGPAVSHPIRRLGSVDLPIAFTNTCDGVEVVLF